MSISLRTDYGPVRQIGSAVIVVESQALIARLPIGGFVWNRPVAIHLTQEGRSRRVRIVDLTRIAQLCLFGTSITLLIVTRIQTRQSRELPE